MNDTIDINTILNLPEDEVNVLAVNRTDDGIVNIFIEKANPICFCSECGTRMHSKGVYVRKVKHPVLNGPYAGESVLNVEQRKWKCPNCGHYENDSFSFIEKGKQSTDIMPLMILEELKNPNVTCRDVAERFNVSDTTVHYTFLRYVDLPRLPLSRIISIDEVYLDLDDKHRYAMVIMDFIKNEVIDILPGRGKDVTDRYFASIPAIERNQVEYIISDMYKPYIAYAGTIFPNAVSLVDSFHVISWLLNKTNLYINDVKKRYQAIDRKKLAEKNYKTNRDHKTIADSREVMMLKNYRWILLKNTENINYVEKYHRFRGFGGMYMNTYQLEKMFLDLDPKFRDIRTLKEMYVTFNKEYVNRPDEAGTELDCLIELYRESDIALFCEFADLLTTYKDQIITSFQCVTIESEHKAADIISIVRRLSNGPMESYNNFPKDIKRISNGVSNFEFTRNRILWATRKNPSMLGVPKDYKEVCPNTGTKRGPYKK